MANERIKIITTSGFKYFGDRISEDSNFIEIKDFKLGRIKIPLVSISFIQEASKSE